MSHTTDALPDHALDAEAAVLGACILDPAALDVIGWLRTEDFFSTPHRLVFAAARRLREAGTPADAVTLGSHLRDRGELVEVGGLVRLGDLLFACPAVEDVAHYARIVQQAAAVRALGQAAFALSVRCRAPVADRPGLLAEARAAIEAATELGAVQTPGVAVGELVGAVLTAAASPESGVGRTLTGFSALDRATTGLAPGDLWILAARPGFGKTALACNLALNVAFAGQGVLFFSLEMPGSQIGERLACSEAHVDLGRLRARALQAEDWTRFGHAQERLRDLPLWVDDSKNLTPAEMLARGVEHRRRLQREGRPLGLVVIDYLQLAKTTARKDRSREQEVAEVSRALKAMAGTLGCPVLALAQLSRSSEQQGRRPRASDLRESGQVEQDADGILFLHRDKDTPRGCLDVVIAKQRQGLITTLSLAWWPRFMRFLDPDQAAPAQEGLAS